MLSVKTPTLLQDSSFCLSIEVKLDHRGVMKLGLPQLSGSGYRTAMDDTIVMILLVGGGLVLWMIGYQRYRRWKAGKLADQLLQDVIKGKDAFRR